MIDNVTISTLEVRKDSWSETRVVTEPLEAELQDNEVLFSVDRQALTANNISYAASGNTIGYWGFFPANEGWGRLPAMGWGEVIASAHPDIEVGERVWGFFPFSTHLKILAGKVRADQFHDVSPHRVDYAPIYSQFDRASANPFYEKAREDQDSLLRGLFLTSWLVEDFMDVNNAFGAAACIITSASSKTSIALGYNVKQRGKLASIGLTSSGNADFCKNLGCYDEILTYDDLANLDANQSAFLVDMAGSAKLLSDIHHQFGDNIKYSCRIGATHYEDMGPVDGLPGAQPEFFFAPGHIQTRSAEMGAMELMGQLGNAYVGFRQYCDGWLRIESSLGEDAVRQIYRQVLAGNADPGSGQIFSMRSDPAE